MHAPASSASVQPVAQTLRFLLAALWLLAPSGWLSGPAGAGGTEAFIQRIGEARTLFRLTVTSLREGRADEAGQQLGQLTAHWTQTVQTFRDRPPAIFARIGFFPEMLDGSVARLARASEALAQGRAETALEELSPIRQEWIRIRRAAGLYGLAECLDEATAALDAFLAMRRTPPDLSRAETRGEVIARAAVYRFALRRCDAFAAQDMMAEPDYQRRVDGIMAALDVVDSALRLRDPALLDRVLTDLRTFDLQLSHRHGG